MLSLLSKVTPNKKDSQFSLHNWYCHADRVMLSVIWFHFLLCLAVASVYNTWTEALMIGLPAALIPTALGFTLKGSIASRLSIAASFMVFSALLIHQMHGMIEMHFGIFGLLAFLLFYRDWKPVILAAVLIAVHHVGFFILQSQNAGVFLFPSADDFTMVLVHAAYVVFETAILIYMSRQSHGEAVQNSELQEIGQHMAIDEGVIPLDYRQANPQSPFAHDYNQFIEGIHNIVCKTRDAATGIVGSLADLISISTQASQGMQQQHNEIDQVSTAITQMAATSQEVARHAETAAAKADEASENANRGVIVVNDTIEMIRIVDNELKASSDVLQTLEEASEQIGQVMVVIKGIAEQTNLLALNAAIEAARAGEQGRGFAVVADEVRNLASRTQESTSEIEGVIDRLQSYSKNAIDAMGKSREKSIQCVDQASEASEALQAIVGAITQINQMNTQIASAAEEQKAVSDEINRNVSTINQVSDETAEASAKTTLATSNLNDIAQSLQQDVSQFRI